jgi:hypothetical protein
MRDVAIIFEKYHPPQGLSEFPDRVEVLEPFFARGLSLGRLTTLRPRIL